MIKPLHLQRAAGELGRVVETVVGWASHVQTEALARLVPVVVQARRYVQPGEVARSDGKTVVLPPPSPENRGKFLFVCADGDVSVEGPTAGTGGTSVSGDAMFLSDGSTRWAAIHGSRPGWRDALGEVRYGSAAAAITWEAYRTSASPWIAPHMRHDQDDSLSMIYQLNHDWDRTTAVECHLHWEPMANPATTEIVSFSGRYAWAPAVSGRTAYGTWTSFRVTDTVTSGDMYTGRVTTLFTATPPAGLPASSMLRVYMQRDGTGTTDTYTTSKASGTAQANLLLDYQDVHYFANRVGTVGRYADR